MPASSTTPHVVWWSLASAHNHQDVVLNACSAGASVITATVSYASDRDFTLIMILYSQQLHRKPRE